MSADKKVVEQFAYRRSPDQEPRREPMHRPVIVVGAGPVGMSLALDLASRGIAVLLLDDADRIGEGSRGICWAKRTLEIFDRLGVAGPILDKGVVWQKGKVFLAGAEVYDFDLLPEGGHQMPAFINLQQYYVEQELVHAVLASPHIELRWSNRVSAISPRSDGAIIEVETPDGPYRLACDWLVCCDGARSPCREMLGQEFKGEAFQDRFLIADVKMTAAFPTERWFWFDPPFHNGQSALLHKQPDDVWRIDLQLGSDADADAERASARVVPRIERMLGHRNFELEWVSIYTFQCRRMERFLHGRVVFAGDAAHQVSPFGARGANSGVQDAENLAWKLAAVLKGVAPPSLIDTYEIERGQAADENIRHSTRSTDFIAPRTATERHFRNAALGLSATTGFARRFVNSGRLSAPTIYNTPLSTPDRDVFEGVADLGAPMPDAPIERRDHSADWFLRQLGDETATVLIWNATADLAIQRSRCETLGARTIAVGDGIMDRDGLLARRLDATAGAVWVIRPDQHLAARFRRFDTEAVSNAIARIHGNS
ncbi:MAG: FAD-dependent oxidoreductase [Hyphomicrobium sp.]